jgi:hypothetical protein
MYTPLMKQAVKTITIPKDFKIDILDYNTFLTIQFYESQWKHYSETERFLCIQYLNKVKKTLENLGAKVALDPILDIKKIREERR